jgi:hypothetical protein
MALSFQSIRDNGNFLFTSGTPGTYYYQRAELSPREAWNLWQDTKNKGEGWLIPLYLTPAEFDRVTAFNPAHPDESRAARIQTVFEECAKLDWKSRAAHDDQARYCGDQNELGKLVILHNPIHLCRQSITIPPAELERAWEVYRARSAAAQPVP